MSILRRFKPLFQLYNLFQYRRLRHNVPLYRRYGLRKRYFDPVSSRDFEGLDAPAPLLDREDSATYLPQQAAFRALPAAWQQALLPWSAQGYAILPGFFDAAQADAAQADVRRLVAGGQRRFEYGGKKLMFAHHVSAPIRALGEDARLLAILDLLMGERVSLFQSINFEQGSEQRTHSDSIHMSTFPQGRLIAAWVALEDVDADSGPLHYYPGSQRLPYLSNKDFGNLGSRLFLGPKSNADYEEAVAAVVARSGLPKRQFLARKGDVLIWHANLLHGGEAMRDKSRTRRSVVFHYYAEGAICYHEISQRPSLRD